MSAPDTAATVLLRCTCSRTIPAELAAGWLNETWPTIGGGTIHVVACPPCRRLVVPFTGSARCDGRCGGAVDADAAARAVCNDCTDDDYSLALIVGITTWSCWDEACVRAWAASEHPTCDVELVPGRAA